MGIIRSCSCSGEEAIQLGGSDDASLLTAAGCGCPSRLIWWRAAWRRLISRMFGRPRRIQCCYDEKSYAQNFDDGRLWDEDEADNMGRSFSMRFADPSRMRFLNEEVRLLDL